MNPQYGPAMECDPFAAGERLHVGAVIVDPAYQIRGAHQLDRAQVRRYADAMTAGQVHAFPPVKAWRVDGALFLIDGFHRVAAAKHAGCEDSLAVEVVGAGSFEEGRWLAFEANRQHGLPIKTRAMREGFKAYVRARKHRHPEGHLKSYREMACDLGIGHTTIRHWMRRFFPSVFSAMHSEYYGERREMPGDAPHGPVLPPDHIPMTPLELLEQAMRWAAERPEDALANTALLAKVEKFAAELRERPRAGLVF